MQNGSITNRAASTGFFWRYGSKIYLITARHCITGRDGSNAPLCEESSFDPTDIQIYFLVPGEDIEKNARYYSKHKVSTKLWQGGYPVWLEHSRGAQIDVVAIDFSKAGFDVHCINDKQQIVDWELEAGADCLIVGYPEAMAGSRGTPIWKRASIASEPNLDFDDLPIFLCDSATRKGISGAPVFAKLQGDFGQHGRPLPNVGQRIFGYWTKFIGIYTGRNGNEADGFQLGRVWKTEVIQQILETQEKAKSPFKRSARP